MVTPARLISRTVSKIVAHQERGEAQRRLVEQQQLRVGHQRPADGQHLLLAAGEGAGELVAPFLEPREQREDALAVFLDARLVAAQGVGAHVQVFVHRQRREDLAAFGRM